MSNYEIPDKVTHHVAVQDMPRVPHMGLGYAVIVTVGERLHLVALCHQRAYAELVAFALASLSAPEIHAALDEDDLPPGEAARRLMRLLERHGRRRVQYGNSDTIQAGLRRIDPERLTQQGLDLDTEEHP